MNDDRLIAELRVRAAEDAQRFRSEHPGEQPNDRWIDNSYTAALPLAKDRSGIDPGLGPHPQLFEIYASEIATRVGARESSEADKDAGAELVQQPTPGEK
ncbi:MAG TPA: hypothetical protein VFN10_16395 [Thermoanaerobaculia bacterium]|nr:hypothetical protein [Thermoanaerobaculia bacterium]